MTLCNYKPTTWKGKYRSMKNTEQGKGKGKFLPKIEEISDGNTETYSKYFDSHRCLSQSQESECISTHNKDDITRVFERCHQSIAREEGMEGNLKGNYLRLCLEDRMN